MRSLCLLFLATAAQSSILPWNPYPGNSPPNSYPSGYPSYPSDCPTCTKPKQCSNAGWDWAYYPNQLVNEGENYPGFRADAFKSETPTYAGVTPAIGGLTVLGVDGTIYNSTATDLSNNFYVLNHQGYLWACEAGAWQFDVTGVDDLVLAWVGDTVYNGSWTDDNAQARAVWSFQSQVHAGSASLSTDLAVGSFVPLRFVFANAQNGGAFRLTITSPSGIIVHQTGRDANNDWIVRFGCPGEPDAPKFPAFGQKA